MTPIGRRIRASTKESLLRRTAMLACGALILSQAAAAQTGPATATNGTPGETRSEAKTIMERPVTRVESVVEEIHGVKVSDPYRWLEKGDDPEVRGWVEAQNSLTRSLLDARPGREALRQRLTRLLSIGTLGNPVPRGGRYFYTRREGEQNQPILYVRKGLRGEDRVLVDPNRLSADGTATIDWWYPSEDGSLLAYGISTSGDEKSTLHLIEVDSGRSRPDTIPHTRYSSLAWLPDNSGFYYTRYPAPGSVPPGQENYNNHVFFHRLGDDPASDARVFGEGRRPEDMIDIRLSPDGRYLLATAFQGWARSDLYVRDLKTEGSTFTPIAEGIDAIFTGEVVGDTLYMLTNWEAPRYRLLGVDLKKPARENWRPLIPEGEAVLNQVAYVGGQIVTLYLKDASSRVVVFGADGHKLRDIALPTLGTVESISGRHDGREAFFDFNSFTVPPAVYRYDLKTGATALWEKVKTDVDLSGLEVRQVFYPSKDGTKISMFLVHRKGLKPDGSTPTLLRGYGGFNVNETPEFSRSAVLWLERGGLYASTNLRGGGEYGEAWHRAGMLEKKQNVFDDFVAAAEWLIANKYTSRERLAISGGSNGGLLVGAALTQRPDLYRAVVCAVPLLDMVRYHNFQIARLWVPEYGSAESADQFRWLYAYSPYHHVVDGTAYPAVLLTTAESDSRVDPMHARKMTARLQAADTSSHPILLRTETKAGHGIGKPVSKLIDEATDTWSFLLWQLGLEPTR
ncbi:MAG TPA: prolyl oligopeptidase family serine peptidase [Candidatus Polarisedimenticolia bacterium]|nr:prolyl oligopeptidase family serine peptidase [Candidatus Polarisedimenticolia bacterium]